jgi:hypothetical protein
MAIYLRDQHVQNLSLDKEAISQINNLFIERFTKLQTELALENKDAFLTHVIRFDHKGYRVLPLTNSLDTLIKLTKWSA